MNALTPIDADNDVFRHAEAEANQCRGRLINLYAKVEGLITGALLTNLPQESVPMLLSQKIARLKEVMASDDDLIVVLNELDALLDERNALVHGEGSVWISRRGQWLLRLRHQARKGTAELTLCEAESKASHDRLHKVAQRLSAKLKA